MAGDNFNQGKSISDKADDYRDAAVSTASDYKDAAVSTARDLGDKAADVTDEASAKASSIADDLKETAAHHVGEARNVVTAMANEARSKISEIVDQQKSAGAEQLEGLSRAAQNAAGDLDDKNPQVARLMRDAATSVDRFAGDLRSSSLTDVVASVSSFARKQPVAFFAASVLAGFVLARFIKSEPAQDDLYRSSSSL